MVGPFSALLRQSPVHANMAQLGPATWAKLHQLADDFAGQVGSDCSCGTTMQGAMRGFHDAVNMHLGKPVQHPEDLKRLAAFVNQAVGSVDVGAPPGRLRVVDGPYGPNADGVELRLVTERQQWIVQSSVDGGVWKDIKLLGRVSQTGLARPATWNKILEDGGFKKMRLHQLVSQGDATWESVEVPETEEDKRRAAAVHKLFESALEE